MRCRTIEFVVVLACVVCGRSFTARAVEVYTSGLTFPETLSQAPDGFGSYVGDYFVPDPGAQKLWWISQGTGTAVEFADFATFGPKVQPMGGVFLPDSGWGNQSGNFLTVAGNADNLPPAPGLGPPAEMYTTTPSGDTSLLVKLTGNELGAPFMISPRVARFVPDTFGSGAYAGQLSITDFQGGVHLFQPLVQPNDSLLFSSEVLYDHNRPDISGTALDINPWDAAVAPVDFGSVGGTMLVSDSKSGRIISVDENGNVAPFTTISLLAGQTGLRNFEFGPADFLSPLGISGQQLFVSVTATNGNVSGICGDVLALDSSGNVVASLRTIDNLDKFDPRGMLFGGDQLLVCDTSDPIVIAVSQDFREGRLGNVPEPSSLAMSLGAAVVCIGVAACRRRKAVP